MKKIYIFSVIIILFILFINMFLYKQQTEKILIILLPLCIIGYGIFTKSYQLGFIGFILFQFFSLSMISINSFTNLSQIITIICCTLIPGIILFDILLHTENPNFLYLHGKIDMKSICSIVFLVSVVIISWFIIFNIPFVSVYLIDSILLLNFFFAGLTMIIFSIVLLNK